MRSVPSLLLLLLMLPGLLLPAGALWHLCGCAEPMPARTRSCCASADAMATATATAKRTPPPSARVCCQGKVAPTPSDENRDDGDEPPRASADDCACRWLPLGDDRPAPAPPGAGPQLALAPLPARFPLSLPITDRIPPPDHRWSVAATRPPPDHERSLPLRL